MASTWEKHVRTFTVPLFQGSQNKVPNGEKQSMSKNDICLSGFLKSRPASHRLTSCAAYSICLRFECGLLDTRPGEDNGLGSRQSTGFRAHPGCSSSLGQSADRFRRVAPGDGGVRLHRRGHGSM